VKLITWNIQWGLGVDGRVDLRRIVNTAREMGDFDVLCLQEVTSNYPALAGNNGDDQFAALAALLPEYHAISGVAVDRFTPARGRQQFGNMIFTRLPVLQVLRHQLPWPAEPTLPTMPRLALELVLDAPGGALRVTTTHLEFYSALQRMAQVRMLHNIHADAESHAADEFQRHKIGSPFETLPRGARAILTGDFNCLPDDEAIKHLQKECANGAPGYIDAWPLAHPNAAHAHTVDLHDAMKAPRCFDYVFVSDNLRDAVRALTVNAETAASDHQPLLLEVEL